MPDRKPVLTEAARQARAERDARAAQALRDNLRRRKQQSRAREALPEEPATMATRPTVLFISLFGGAGTYDPAAFRRMPGGDDDTVWMRMTLDHLGLAPRIDYRAARPHCGEALPDPAGIDAVILGGSIDSVHDNHPWQACVRDFLQRWRETRKPLFGICGGHQMASAVEGGVVDTMQTGKIAGSYPIERTAEGQGHFLFDGFPADQAFHFSHNDRVAVPPPGAVVLARRVHTPHAALDHGGNWYSVQFHPEATADLFATVYADQPDVRARYRVLAHTERMLLNFLTGTGVVPAGAGHADVAAA